jgi:hypothetical protein
MLLKWKKLEESSCRVILVAGPSLENWGLEPSGAILRHQTTFFGLKFPSIVTIPRLYSTYWDLSNNVKIINQSSYENVMPPTS